MAYYRSTLEVCRSLTTVPRRNTSSSTGIPSFGFSGSGFLACYHLGAAKCFLDHGYLDCCDKSGKLGPRLTGVSGGALIAAAVAAGVDPEVGMETTLKVAQRTRQHGGFLDVFRPGFSLIDQVEEPYIQNIVDAIGGDTEFLLRRINGGRLRIGLTNRTTTPFLRNPKAYCYVEEYRDAHDIAAACMLSSFIPGGTGLFSGSSDTILGSSKRLREMVALGYVKQIQNGETVTVKLPTKNRDDGASKSSSVHNNDAIEDDFPNFQFLDGGLSNPFPVFDSSTVVVSPLCGIFDPNPFVSPAVRNEKESDGTPNLLRVSSCAQIYMTQQNAHSFRRIALSSDDATLQERWVHGYDDAKRFLVDNNLEKIHLMSMYS